MADIDSLLLCNDLNLIADQLSSQLWFNVRTPEEWRHTQRIASDFGWICQSLKETIKLTCYYLTICSCLYLRRDEQGVRSLGGQGSIWYDAMQKPPQRP